MTEKLFIELKQGTVEIQLRPDLAPKHVEQIKFLVRNRFYDGLKWHRVIGGFMAQTGCPKGDGTGGCGLNLPAEFSNEPHVRGTCSMARSQLPNSASSQFFICLNDSRHLDSQYTVWGHVVKGMEFVDQIKLGGKNNNGSVDDPDIIIKIYLDEPELRCV